MNYFAVLIHFFVVFLALGQTKSLQLKEFGTDEPVPFVKVTPIGFSPQLADLDGIVTLPLEAKEVRLHCLGFKDTTIIILDEKDVIVYLKPAVNTLDLVNLDCRYLMFRWRLLIELSPTGGLNINGLARKKM